MSTNYSFLSAKGLNALAGTGRIKKISEMQDGGLCVVLTDRGILYELELTVTKTGRFTWMLTSDRARHVYISQAGLTFDSAMDAYADRETEAARFWPGELARRRKAKKGEQKV